MPSKLPYTPRHSAYALHTVKPDPLPTAAAALASMVRTHPDRVRRSALSLLATGVLIFGVTEGAGSALGEANPVPGLPSAAQVAEAVYSAVPQVGIESPDTSWRHYLAPAQPIGNFLGAAPVHVEKKAPATKAVIKGLAANGIPNVALNAYRVAAARVNHTNPGCGVDWALLAGIGRVESDHGRFAGAVLNPDGTSTPRIMGPALDGVLWDYIPAPANGLELYGDGVYAHALGPMQFIPSTWAIYGADGNGDGRADVFNVNDAALGAARYLCAAGGDLRTAAGQQAAVLAYNHSDQYLAQVLALANAYRNGIPVTGIPVGDVSGALPPLDSVGGYVPPVNPADPTAVGASSSSPAAHTIAKPSRPRGSGSNTGGTGSGGTTGSTGSGAGSGTGSSGTGTGGTTGGGTAPGAPGVPGVPGVPVPDPVGPVLPPVGGGTSAPPAPAPDPAPAPAPDPAPTTPSPAPTTSPAPTPPPTTAPPKPNPICVLLPKLPGC